MSSTDKTISIIIPLYYCDPSLYQLIEGCFSSIRTYYPEVELIVVDDCSPLDHPFFTTTRNRENKGFTVTVNTGLKIATGDILIVMNDDIMLTSGCLEEYKTLSGLRIHSLQDTSGTTDDRFGAIWGMTRETYELLGGLDEKYRNFYSDRDYYDRAKENGVKITKNLNIVLEHPESSTFKKVNKEELLKADLAYYRLDK